MRTGNNYSGARWAFSQRRRPAAGERSLPEQVREERAWNATPPGLQARDPVGSARALDRITRHARHEYGIHVPDCPVCLARAGAYSDDA